MATRNQAPTLTLNNDPALLERARRGDHDAFDELFDRHAPRTWSIAQAVARTADGAAEATVTAFMTVLVAPTDASAPPIETRLQLAARHAALDGIRRPRSAPAGKQVVDLTRSSDIVTDGPSARSEEADVARRAFDELPERHRTILWLHEVEEAPIERCAPVLELDDATTAKLAHRANAALLEHTGLALAAAAEPRDCRRSSERLAGHVAGTLRARDVGLLERHVNQCPHCAGRLVALRSLPRLLRTSALPMPAALAFAATERFRKVATPIGGRAPLTQRIVAGVAALLLAGGVVGATFFGSGERPARELAQPANQPGAVQTDGLPEPDLDLSSTNDPGSIGSGSQSDRAGSSLGADDVVDPSENDRGAATVDGDIPPAVIPRDGDDGRGPATPPPDAGSEPDVHVPQAPVPAQADTGVTVGDQSMAVSVGECTGVEVADTQAGCTSEDAAPEEDGVDVGVQTPLPGLEDAGLSLP